MLIWNKEKLPHQLKKTIVLPIHKRVIKLTVVIIEVYHFCQLYKILSNVLFSRLIPYADEIIWDHQCGLRCNGTTDHILYIHHILKKKWKYNCRVHQLFIEFKKVCDSGRKYYIIFSMSLEYPGNNSLVYLTMLFQ
jgi:hypothetical protein